MVRNNRYGHVYVHFPVCICAQVRGHVHVQVLILPCLFQLTSFSACFPMNNLSRLYFAIFFCDVSTFNAHFWPEKKPRDDFQCYFHCQWKIFRTWHRSEAHKHKDIHQQLTFRAYFDPFKGPDQRIWWKDPIYMRGNVVRNLSLQETWMSIWRPAMGSRYGSASIHPSAWF